MDEIPKPLDLTGVGGDKFNMLSLETFTGHNTRQNQQFLYGKPEPQSLKVSGNLLYQKFI